MTTGKIAESEADTGLSDTAARLRIEALEERVLEQDRRLSSLSNCFHQLRSDFSTLRDTFKSFNSEIHDRFGDLDSRLISTRELSSKPISVPVPVSVKLDSQILSSFPTLFDDFGSRGIVLLYRGSRDGFEPADFHRHCDGHRCTLTVVQSTTGFTFGGFTFGGFTPLGWDSTSKRIDDPSNQSFLFTLTNPHKVSARKFHLRTDVADRCAIFCLNGCGPCFTVDLWFHYNFATKDYCQTRGFGTHYSNDTGLPGETFFTGTTKFQVRELEVFEISS
jgi:uncharacterized coiled-coil protein SlyX